MTRALPPQHPIQPPRYRFRPRSDKHHPVPRGRMSLPRASWEPREPLDGIGGMSGGWERFRDEPQPLSWDDMTPANLVGGLVVFVAMALFVFAVSIVEVGP